MTLSERNRFFKAGIAICSVITLLMLAVSFLTIPIYSAMEENTRRPERLFQAVSGWFLENSYFSVHASIAAIVLFSFIGIILIHSFFERTSAPEILYISCFTVSCSFEVIRLIIPLHLIYSFPSFYLIGAWRVLLFARYFGLFSLFTAGICAAGLEVQRTRNIVLIMTIAVLIIVLGVPIDTQAWDTGFNAISGFAASFMWIEAIVFITAAISFFIARKVRGSKDYVYVGIGVLLALAGRGILLGTDNWAGPLPGIFLLSFGTWFICSKVHKIHLWL